MPNAITRPETVPATFSGRVAAARSPSTSPALLRQLASTLEPTVLLALAKNVAAPISVLRGLTSSYHAVRRAVASHPLLTEADIYKLAGDIQAGVRKQVARRRRLPPSIRAELLTDNEVEVRIALARSRATGESETALRKLSQDLSLKVRLTLAKAHTFAVAHWMLQDHPQILMVLLAHGSVQGVTRARMLLRLAQSDEWGTEDWVCEYLAKDGPSLGGYLSTSDLRPWLTVPSLKIRKSAQLHLAPHIDLRSSSEVAVREAPSSPRDDT